MSVGTPYPPEVLDEDDDNGTMPENVATLAESVVGHKIVAVEEDAPWLGPGRRGGYGRSATGLRLTLDDGRSVFMFDSSDCCAYTALDKVLKSIDMVDHIITGVGTTDGYTTWHIYADLGDVLELSVGWSCGNPFYYGYGFDIEVYDPSIAYCTDCGRPLSAEGHRYCNVPDSEKALGRGLAGL
jgi:hypothetical protein